MLSSKFALIAYDDALPQLHAELDSQEDFIIISLVEQELPFYHLILHHAHCRQI